MSADTRRWSSRREASRRAQKGYRRQKFPGLSAVDVRTPLARWKRVREFGLDRVAPIWDRILFPDEPADAAKR